MPPRLKSGVLVSALIRRVAQDGGSAMVLARGDSDAGGIVLVCAQRGEITRLIELGRDLDGQPEWRAVAPQVVEKSLSLGDYVERRRSIDPDLWVVELDNADSERFAAEIIAQR